MKSLIVLCIVLLFSSIALGLDSEAVQKNYSWAISPNGISAQRVALASRDMNTAVVNTLTTSNAVFITLEDGTYGVDFRFRILGGAENSTDVIEHYVYASSTSGGDDFWIHIATHTITQGQQNYSGTTNYFADTISDANWVWYHASVPVCPVNSIAFEPMETFGFMRHLFIVSSLTSGHTVYVDCRRW
jgi:hypothetical protein